MQLGTSGGYAACILMLQDGEHFPAKHSSEVAFSYPTPAWILFCSPAQNPQSFGLYLSSCQSYWSWLSAEPDSWGQRSWERGFPEDHESVHRLQGKAEHAQDHYSQPAFSGQCRTEPILDLMIRTKKREYVQSLCKTLDFDELCFLCYKRQTIHLVFINIKMQSKKGILG